jgi:hypothetical protein
MGVRWATVAVVLASATLASAIWYAVVKLLDRREGRPDGILTISKPANPKFESVLTYVTLAYDLNANCRLV